MTSIFKDFLKKYDALLISSWGNIIYLTGYSGFSQTERECLVLITKTKQYLITDKRYSEAVKEQAAHFRIEDCGVAKFIAKDHSNILKNLRIRTIGVEENNLTVSEFKKLKKHVKNIKNVDLSKLRIIKKNEEIENIKKACGIGDLAFEFITQQLKVGVSEKELADKLETFINIKGADFSFKPIVAFGKNSSVPHHLSGNTKLKKNQIVLLDFGVKVNNYCSDMSRTIFFGKAPDKFRKIYQTVLKAQKVAIDYINNFYSSSEHSESRSKFSTSSNNNLFACDIDKVARDYIVKQGFPNMFHSLGHGVGVEVHEPPHISPNSKDVIKEGMVFSIEPGIYIPGFGGVRIEDLVLVTKNGAELISGANRGIIQVQKNDRRTKAT